MDDPAWTAAPYVLCEHCDRETLVEDGILDVGRQVPCSHCGSELCVHEVKVTRQTRCVIVRFPPDEVSAGSSMDPDPDDADLDDELTPVESPRPRLGVVKP